MNKYFQQWLGRRTGFTVKMKLSIMVALSFVSLVVVGLAGGIGVKRIGDSLAQIGEQSMPSVMMLTELRMWQLESLLINREAATWNPDQYRDYADKSDPLSEATSVFDSVVERRLQADQKVMEAVSAYEKLPKSEAEQVLWAKVQQNRTEFADAYDRMLLLLKNMAKQDNWQSLMTDYAQFKAMEARVGDLWLRMEQNIDACLDETRAGAQQAQQSGHQTLTGAMTVITTVFLLAVGLLALMAIFIARSVVGAFAKMHEAVAHVAKTNDFRCRIDWNSADEAGQTVTSFNSLLENVHDFLRYVLNDAARITEGANEAAEAAKEVSAASKQQTNAATGMATSTERMTISINQISESARKSLGHAKDSGAAADEGGGIISSMVGEIETITKSVSQASMSINELGIQSERISIVVQVIKDIADQTNLLALNAAIEAARAGENGRGFAVVADEVRKLSERTAGGAKEISTMVMSMQEKAREAIRDMDLVVIKVGEGKRLSSQAAERMEAIRTNASRVVEAISAISAALSEQSVATTEMSGKVDWVASMSHDNSVAAGRTADVATRLWELAESLRTAVSRFQV